ncbi:TetR family transcriptional regulator [Pseudonocardia cypriaca]|uniref:TetR family transcriptional regulator n=1 Tax=Pseudonocardia cypriaca TaxID=882449 RepID=UPI001152BB3B|nr:TetR family transcriptional regulator [Pseudonocardia cypriaca]
MSGSGLRERKKQRTREALTDAACTLFARQGVESTTVEQIAAAIDVSPRTFFRYFPSKEDVAVSVLDQQLTEVIRALEARPPGESVLTALRRAVVGTVRAHEDAGSGDGGIRLRSVRALLLSSPTVRAASLHRGALRSGEMARLLAVRMGVDPVRDGRPQLVASIVLCALEAAVAEWQVHRPDAPLSNLLEEAFDLLAGGLDYPSATA